MSLPILCASDCVQHYLMSYRDLFSQPHQDDHNVLVGFLHCQQARSPLWVATQRLSRFLAKAPWETKALGERWRADDASGPRQHAGQPTRRGRPKRPVVTGSLTGDDSTMRDARKAARWKTSARVTQQLMRDGCVDGAWFQGGLSFCNGTACWPPALPAAGGLRTRAGAVPEHHRSPDRTDPER
jgi:hypothetical protein